MLRTSAGLSVFCQHSDVEVHGYADPQVGSLVWFDDETPGQDGCDARVPTAARPGRANPDVPLGTLKRKSPEPPSLAFRSGLTVTYDGGRVETFDDNR